MEQAVVAVFDTQQDAQSALEALVSAGFSRNRARITAGDSTAGAAASSTTSSRQDGESFGEMIADFFGFGDHDETYSEAVRRGAYVVTVDAADDEEADRAQTVLSRFGPVDIDQRATQWRQSGWQPSRASLSQESSRSVADSGRAGAVIPVTEEELAVGKRDVQRGGVRVISRTVERPVEANVSLREEHATVTRRPVDRPVTDADNAFRDASVEVRETAEVPVVGKSARVVEEVHVGKEASVREETIHDTVRKTEVDVEDVGSRTDIGRSETLGRGETGGRGDTLGR